ncbi:MAG: NAD(P)/FAD-dependent oxidoreductase [Flavobacteriales bacterium]|nr:NAD(P)/FAD-dependent oxidoreductase [Flavobacteriales bacterium]MBK9287426.1 NAD(P)/FAD-dependent oxidoreductase [Flavobacteriales bacterium]MBL0036241.1 NAD(P)/FAD-dependent oxidoreductase [Flavobacteriales bacterium]
MDPSSSPTPPLKALTTDVYIIGGGPGGCAAALQLAKHGIRSTLIERAMFPRDKVCGDALSGKVMRTLERLDPALAARVNADAHRMPSWGVTFVAPGGKALRVPFSRETGIGEAPGAILPRLDFDAILFDAVKRNEHVQVLEGVQAKNYERTEKGWRISLVGNNLPTATANCQLILAADGANSAFARHVAGLPMEPKHHAAGVRAYYRGIHGLDPQGFIELHFLKELVPGYLWIFPLPDGRANVGLGLRSDHVRERRLDLKAELLRLVSSHPTLRGRFAHAELEGSVQGLGLPLASKRHPLSGEGYLLIGDAGHLIDPFTGEGISHAMISGVHAADVANEALKAARTDAPFLKSYDERVWKRLGKELTISTRLQQLAHQAWLFDFVVERATKNPALADTISSMFTDLDLRERLKKPGFYMDLVLGRKVKG